MAPSEIVERAVAAGVNGIALTDHQSARNTPAIAECARRAGLGCLFGMEVQTSEEVHTLALFDTTEQALALTDWVYAAMPKRVNDPETFGDPPVVTWDTDLVEMEWRILAMVCRRTIPETATKVHELGGLYIAAHVDRANHSVLGTLGAIPEPLVESEIQPGGGKFFDAVELSRTAELDVWLPRVEGYALTRSSDAHNLDDVALVWTEAEGEFSVAGLKAIFAAKATRLSPRLTRF